MESMFGIFKNYLIPAVKEEIKKNAEDFVESTLYSKPYDFSQTVGYTGNQQIRVIGNIVTIY